MIVCKPCIDGPRAVDLTDILCTLLSSSSSLLWTTHVRQTIDGPGGGPSMRGGSCAPLIPRLWTFL